jgi:hypothetical protein
MGKVHDKTVFAGAASGHAAVATDLLGNSWREVHHDTRFSLEGFTVVEGECYDLGFMTCNGILDDSSK